MGEKLGDFRKLPPEIRGLIWKEVLQVYGDIPVTFGTWEGKGRPIRDKDGRFFYPQRWHYPTRQPEVRTQLRLPSYSDHRPDHFGACIPSTMLHKHWSTFIQRYTQSGAQPDDDEGACIRPSINAVLYTSTAIYNDAFQYFFKQNNFVFCACAENLQDARRKQGRVAQHRFNAIDVLYAFLCDMQNSKGMVVGYNLGLLQNIEVHLTHCRASTSQISDRTVRRWIDALELLKTVELVHLTICMTNELPEVREYTKLAKRGRNARICDASILGELARLKGRVQKLTVRYVQWQNSAYGPICRVHGQQAQCNTPRVCGTSRLLLRAAAAFKVINDSIQPTTTNLPAVCKLVDFTRPSTQNANQTRRTRFVEVEMSSESIERVGFISIDTWVDRTALAGIGG